MAEPKMIDATWLLEVVDWGRALGMADAEIFARILGLLRTAAAKSEAPAEYAAEGEAAAGE